MTTRQLKKKLLAKKAEQSYTRADFLSLGSTELNLACSGRHYGGLLKGHYYFMAGDTDSGKSFIAHEALAQASINPNFDKYRLIYDDVEHAALMNIRKLFGNKLADRIEPPAGTRKEPIYSTLVEEFYYHMDDATEDGRPFIYVLDSETALTSIDERKKFQKLKAAHRTNTKEAGSYGDGKPKKHSGNIRDLMGKLARTGSILIILSQSRDNINPFTARMDPKVAPGGHALKFYATIQMWTSIKSKIRTIYKGVKRQQGVVSKVRVKRSKITGRDRVVFVPIYYSYGIDNIGACIDYLTREKYWSMKKNVITAPEFDFTGKKEALVTLIEELESEKELSKLVGKAWNEIEEAIAIKRKPRYS